MNIGQKTAYGSPVRVTHRFSRTGTLAANFASKRHKGNILTDSASESKTASALQYLKGVGPARAQVLARMGILQPMDLLTYFPRDWEDRRVRFSIREAPIGEKIALRGTIRSADFSTTRSQLGIATAQMEDSTGALNAVWFKKLTPRYDVFSSLRQHLQAGRSLFVFGSIEWGPGGRQIRVEDMALCENPESKLSGDDVFHFERIVPVYTVPEGMNERFLRTLIGRVLTQGYFPIQDIYSRNGCAVKKAGRTDRWALSTIHFPKTLLEKEQAREALGLRRIFYFRNSARPHPARRQASHQKSSLRAAPEPADAVSRTAGI